MIGFCEDCKHFGKCGLPSDYDQNWLERGIPIQWRCPTCYWEAREDRAITTGSDHIYNIEVKKGYLIKPAQLIPFLASLAFIIMVCLEIACHSLT